MQHDVTPQETQTNVEETIFNESELLSHDYDKRVKQARNALFFVAAVQFVLGLIIGFSAEPELRAWNIGLMTGIAVIFLGLALWAGKKPYPALLTGLIFYCALLLLDVIMDPLSILRGVIAKAFIIFYLVRGIQHALEAKRLKQALGSDN